MSQPGVRWPGRWALVLALTAALLGAALPARAGRSCEDKPPTLQSISQGLELARVTAQALDQSGAQVVVLARAGQDLRKYGLQYSHLGLAYRSDAGVWRVLHKLNHCGSAQSSLYLQGLGDFFLDDPWRYDAAWAVPTPAAQQQLLALLNDPARATALHQPAYSMVSYAWGLRYQQSNQWLIETLAAAVDPLVQERAQAQAWLQAQGYQPTTLALGPLTRLGARVTAANVAFDDHPNAKRFADRIETVTADSVFAWLARARLAGPPQTLRLP